MDSTHQITRWGLLGLLIAATFGFGSSVSAQSTAGSGVSAVPAGLVKEASPGLPVHAFDQVTIGQTIALGGSGHIKISYYASCIVETIDGGTLTVGSFSSRVAGGNIATISDTKACRTVKVATTTSTAESGAVVERVVAFDPRDWQEATVSVEQPLFQPNAGAGGPAHLRITMLDDPQPKLVWQGEAKALPAAYPASAPKLRIGAPYRVELQSGDGSIYSATFSIDPGYTSSSGALANIVLLSP
jgi:hypothetical protein